MKTLGIATLILGMLACGGDDQRRSTTPERAPATETPATETPESAETASGWLDLLRSLRVDMRVGRPANERGPTIEEVTQALGSIGGSLDCERLAWVSDEDGVEEGQCIGTIPIEGMDGIVVANFRRFAIPGESEEPGLLNITFGGPFLGNDAAIGPWLTAVRAKMEPIYGPPMNADEANAADLRWRTPYRHLVLHDPLRAPCGGECNAFLWIGGPEDPELRLRGF